jgi:AhpD family alkylhydroperoxidase
MSTRVQVDEQDRATYRGLVALSLSAEAAAAAAGFSPAFVAVLRLRVSQINGCAFCLRTHFRAAVAAGETTDRLAVLSSWRETEYFSAREAAAIELAEAVTSVSTGPVGAPLYERVAATLSATEISAVTWIAIVMNSFNRVRITNRQAVNVDD